MLLQAQCAETKAAKEAHLILAQTAMQYMDKQKERSRQGLAIIKKFRRKAIFLSGNTPYRQACRAVWILAAIRLQYVIIIDYQKVSWCSVMRARKT